MGEQIPFSIIENLLMNLGSSVSREIGLMYGVRSEREKLQDKLSMIEAIHVDDRASSLAQKRVGKPLKLKYHFMLLYETDIRWYHSIPLKKPDVSGQHSL